MSSYIDDHHICSFVSNHNICISKENGAVLSPLKYSPLTQDRTDSCRSLYKISQRPSKASLSRTIDLGPEPNSAKHPQYLQPWVAAPPNLLITRKPPKGLHLQLSTSPPQSKISIIAPVASPSLLTLINMFLNPSTNFPLHPTTRSPQTSFKLHLTWPNPPKRSEKWQRGSGRGRRK